MSTKTKQETRGLADKIAAQHGCAIEPGAFGQTALTVLSHLEQGDILDRKRLDGCLAALKAAGVNTQGWVS